MKFKIVTMKKVLKISSLVITACFFAVAADAQLASSSPALTTAQLEALKAPSARTTAPAPTTQTASSSKSATVEAVRKDVKATEAKASDEAAGVKLAPTTEAKPAAEAPKLPATSTDGQPAQPAEKQTKSN